MRGLRRLCAWAIDSRGGIDHAQYAPPIIQPYSAAKRRFAPAERLFGQFRSPAWALERTPFNGSLPLSLWNSWSLDGFFGNMEFWGKKNLPCCAVAADPASRDFDPPGCVMYRPGN